MGFACRAGNREVNFPIPGPGTFCQGRNMYRGSRRILGDDERARLHFISQLSHQGRGERRRRRASRASQYTCREEGAGGGGSADIHGESIGQRTSPP